MVLVGRWKLTSLERPKVVELSGKVRTIAGGHCSVLIYYFYFPRRRKKIKLHIHNDN